ncbi:MAG: cyclic 2,3-diphosphoglycerate synthase [Candidatus Brocadiales bacterium]|nr:cyclic 2,3-diphosphoglycerate synthase [Candidatus Bathyanammoxibius amoris]
MKKDRVIIMGAAGRDFHNFNLCFRKDPENSRVVAFTAAQIPGISRRRYPPSLAGKHYPRGIPIYPEERLVELIRKHKVNKVVLAYSDLPYAEVMKKDALVNAAGADFVLLGPAGTMLKSKKPVVAVTAVRTGCGKSSTTRKIAGLLKKMGVRPVVVRHPMPYGDLEKQTCQRFVNYDDLDRHNCTIEEREEYEPLIDRGFTVYAGVDYGKILRRAEREADVIIWDGGNNDFPFFRPDLYITLVDPHRPGHEVSYYPGEINLRSADVIIINKIKTAKKSGVRQVEKNIRECNPGAVVIHASLAITIDCPECVERKKVLVVEDGPTLTHGGMAYGAGTFAAKRYNSRIVDPRPCLTGSLKKVFRQYPHLSKVLPAMGYGPKQLEELRRVIDCVRCDAVISATPTDLSRIIDCNKPIVRVDYKLEEIKGPGRPGLRKVLKEFLARHGL